MISAATHELRIVSAIPGRLRLHVPACAPSALEAIEATLRDVRGIRSVKANALTGNLLVHFDQVVVSADELLVIVSGLSHTQERPLERAPSSRARMRLVHAPAVASIVLALIAARTPLQYLMAGAEALELVSGLSAARSG